MTFFRPTFLQPRIEDHRFIEGPTVFFSHDLPSASAGIHFMEVQPVFHRYGPETHIYPGFLRPVAVAQSLFVAPADIHFNAPTSAGMLYPPCAAGWLPLQHPSAVNIWQQQLFNRCLPQQHCSQLFSVETGRKRNRGLSEDEEVFSVFEPPCRRPRLSSSEDTTTTDAVVDEEEDLLLPDEVVELLDEEPGIWELAEEIISLLDEVPGIWDEGFSVAI
ncbi:uncharacterized protein [Hoplias malabaricus]|uniref:uncharacterized protein isoform X1 n=1 Tax=Hoplias malabaricus TaxID=27720 RepID=UPI0034623AFD